MEKEGRGRTGVHAVDTDVVDCERLGRPFCGTGYGEFGHGVCGFPAELDNEIYDPLRSKDNPQANVPTFPASPAIELVLTILALSLTCRLIIDPAAYLIPK